MRVVVDELPGHVVRFTLSSPITRLNGLAAAFYGVGPLLVDTGFSWGRREVLAALGGREVSAVVLTHHHEDHSGNAGEVAARSRCPIYLRNATHRFEEGLLGLRAYRTVWWGAPADFEALEMPPRVEGGGRTLLPVPIPGHSATHTALFEEATGVVFTGDLFVSSGVTAVMSHENPFESVASLRAVAGLKPCWMYTGHAVALEDPAETLLRKAERIESAAAEAVRLRRSGVPEAEVARRVFPARGRRADRWMDWLTRGEFSRMNFVRACLQHARQ